MNNKATDLTKRHYKGHYYTVIHSVDDGGYYGKVFTAEGKERGTAKVFDTLKEADGAAVRIIQDLVRGDFG